MQTSVFIATWIQSTSDGVPTSLNSCMKTIGFEILMGKDIQLPKIDKQKQVSQ
jgi:hypothetical protein